MSLIREFDALPHLHDAALGMLLFLNYDNIIMLFCLTTRCGCDIRNSDNVLCSII